MRIGTQERYVAKQNTQKKKHPEELQRTTKCILSSFPHIKDPQHLSSQLALCPFR